MLVTYPYFLPEIRWSEKPAEQGAREAVSALGTKKKFYVKF